MRIVFLGDSLTWGGYGGDFVEIIASKMPDHTIINAGVGGDTVINLVRRVEDVIEEHQPDALFVMIGGNDAISYTQPATRSYYKHTKKLDGGIVTPEQFESNYRDLLTTIQLHYVQPLVGLAPTEYNAEIIRAKHEYNVIAQRIAESFNVPILDLETPYMPDTPVERDPIDMGFIIQIGERSGSGWNDYEAERQRFGYSYTFDGMHIMPETAEEFADRIIPFLKEQLSLN